MESVNRKSVLFAVLNWGLGHATRSIPLINALMERYNIIIASSGHSLSFLRNEFPELISVKLPDYNIRLSKSRYLLTIIFALQIPYILLQILREHTIIHKIVKDYKIEFIVSDCRYGVFSKYIPSFFITHQLRIKFPDFLRGLEFLGEWFNRLFFEGYRKIFVVDSGNEHNISGDLSHKGRIKDSKKIVYLGLLSSVTDLDLLETIDVLFSISGPEPQRSYFEKIIFAQIDQIVGKKVAVLGIAVEPRFHRIVDNLEIYSCASREKMNELMNRSRLIVSRSGYSTIMDIIALKKRALLIPTPGQTEQEYLAAILKEKGVIHSAKQSGLNLKKEIETAMNSEVREILGIEINNVEKFIKAIES